MRKILNKKIRYENCIYLLLSCLIFIYGLVICNKPLSGIRIFTSGVVLMVLSSILIISEVILLIIKKYPNVKRILYLLVLIIGILLTIDVLVLGTVRSFITVLNMENRPTSLDPLNLRLAYICLNNYKTILNGILTTLWLSLAGTVVGLIIALLFISLRTLEISSKDKEFIAFLKKIAIGFVKVYVTIFRGTPMMVQAIIIYYFLPGLLANLFSVNQQVINSILSVEIAGFITVTLNTTAYLTEVLRGGIESLNIGQMEAARSLGMSRGKAMRYVILPQGIKNSLPSICNEFIINIKDTSVLSVISVMDLFFVIDGINKKNASQDGIFISAIIYLALTYGISKLLQAIEKKMNLVTKPLPSSN